MKVEIVVKIDGGEKFDERGITLVTDERTLRSSIEELAEVTKHMLYTALQQVEPNAWGQ